MMIYIYDDASYSCIRGGVVGAVYYDIRTPHSYDDDVTLLIK